LMARPKLLMLSVSLKLIIAPLVFIVLGRLFGVEGVALALLAAIGSTPGAAAAYVLAAELGGDARLMAGHVTATTLLAFLAMPFWIWTTSFL
ncbi:MAG TPA: AEC family transporter, partial [Oceanicaulis sp.]|nr:AEC family transporter [Oceanicaulis sp.]